MTKVMLVEDDNNLREIYEARLQAEGYDIVAAKDGEEALVMAKEHHPELVISDVMMPKISGFEMLDILRNTEGLKDVKVIMLTALGQSDDQARADKLGADRYLVKSQVTLEDIVTAAHELIDGEAAAETPGFTVNTDVAPPEPAVVPADPVAVAAAPVAVVEEPVAVAIAPEPVAEPVAATSEPAAESLPLPTVDNATQSVAQEEASVEAKIEDFVTGASSDPAQTAPVAQPEETDSVVFETVAAPAVTEPVVAPLTPAQADAASDDKLMSDAVDTLVANTEPAAEPATSPAAFAPSVTEPQSETQTAAEAGHVPVNGKKVISPTTDGPAKPDLQALLAQEEAKNIQAGNVVAPPTPAEPSTTVAPAPPTAGGTDPNSIAL